MLYSQAITELAISRKASRFLVDILMKLSNVVNDKNNLNAPRELQDAGVPVDNVDRVKCDSSG